MDVVKEIACQSNYVIIGEGVDRAGKTTTLLSLFNATNIPYYKGQRYPVAGDTQYHVKIAENIQFANLMVATKPNLIVDRFHISELAYSMTFGRKVDEDIMEAVDEKLAAANALIIYFDTPIDVCLKRLAPFSGLTKEHYISLKENYAKLLIWTKCPVMFLTPPDNPNDTTIVNHIIEHLRLRRVS